MKMIRPLRVRQNVGHPAVSLKRPTAKLSDGLDVMDTSVPTYYTDIPIDSIYTLICSLFQKLARHKFL